jgi:PAS domain S-box-containing protein
MTEYRKTLDIILDLIRQNPRGLNIREIAELTGVSRISAAKYLDVLAAEEKVEVRVMGKARVFYLARMAITPQSLLNQIPGQILVVNADSCIIQANDQFLTGHFLARDKAVGFPLASVLPGLAGNPAFIRSLEDVLLGESREKEFLLDPGPKKQKFSVTIHPFMVSDASPGAIIMLYERSGTSGSPETSEADRRLQALINEFDVPVCLAQDGKIRMINNRGVDMSGYTREEILSCNPIELFAHPDDVSEVLANHEVQMQGRMLHKPYVVRIVTKTREVRWLDIKSIPLPWHGKPATLNFYYDITDIMSGDAPERENLL